MQPIDPDAPPDVLESARGKGSTATEPNSYRSKQSQDLKLEDPNNISNHKRSKNTGATDEKIAMNILVDQAVPEGSKQAEKLAKQKGLRSVIIELLCFLLFAVTSVIHTVIGHTQHDLFETQQSIQNELDSLPRQFNELQTFADMWDWIEIFQQRIIQKAYSDDGQEYIRLGATPTIVLTDFRLTQRRVQVIKSSEQPEFPKWKTNDLTHSSSFDPEFEDAEDFLIGDNEFLMHSIYDSFEGRGGFVLFLDINMDKGLSDQTKVLGYEWAELKFLLTDDDYISPLYPEFVKADFIAIVGSDKPTNDTLSKLMEAQAAQNNTEPLQLKDPFIEQIEYYKTKSEYSVMGTVAVTGDLLIFNHLSKTYAFIIFQITQTPAGMLKFQMLHVRPIGQRYPGTRLTFFFEAVEWTEVFLVLVYTIKEIIVMILLIRDYDKESRYVKNQFSRQDEKRKKQVILISKQPLSADHKIQHMQNMSKFYMDLSSKKEIIGETPSLWQGFKNTLKSDQRILMYMTAVLLIPVTIIHRMWHKIQDDAGINLATFDDMLDPNSDISKKTRNGALSNTLLQLQYLESLQQVGITIFTMCVIVRVFTLLSKILQRLNLYERTITQVLQFLFMYIFVIFFVLFAFAMFCHIYYGSQLDSFSTLPNSLISIALLALKDTKDLIAMEKFSPNIALTFYMVFVLVVLYFLMDIFIALVQFKYSQSFEETKEKEQTVDQILAQRHWTYVLQTYFNNARLSCQRKQQSLTENAKQTAKAVADQKNFQRRPNSNIKAAGVEDESKIEDENLSENASQANRSQRSRKSHDEGSSSSSSDGNSSSSSSGSSSESSSSESSVGKVSKHTDEEENGQNGEVETETKDPNSSQKQENTAEQRALLEKMNWAVEFAPYDLDADFNENFVHTSTKEDYYVLKQREQRCGKVIWQTVMQLIYTILYLSMLIYRFEVSNSFSHNKDLEEIILSHKVPRESVLFEQQAYYSSVTEIATLDEIGIWFESFQADFDKRTIVVTDELTLETTEYDLYYLLNEKNYIMFQGITVCVKLLQTVVINDIDAKSKAEGYQYTFQTRQEDIYDSISGQTYKYDEEAMNGIGGYCFGIHLPKKDEVQVSSKILEKINILGFDTTVDAEKQIAAVQFHLITAEASSQMASNIEILFKKSEMSTINTDIAINTFKLNYYSKENNAKIAIDVIFIIFMCLNLYMFLNGEFNTLQRFKKWHENKIEPLTPVEKKQRHMQKPQFVRKLQIIFRLANILFVLHIALTCYNEFNWFRVVTDLTEISASIGKFPSKFVTDHINGIKEIVQREQSQLEMHKIIDMKVQQFENYRRLAALNLLLILSLTFKNAAQSKQMRFFLNAMYGTLFASLYFAVILILSFIGFFFYALHSFGYSSVDFKDLSYTSMTVFKMFVGRQLGEYYRVVREIDFYKALIFIVPFMLMNFLFHSIFLAIVCQQYETQVLNADASSDIDLLSAIFFCNITLDRRQKNRRAKAQQENENQMAANNEDNSQIVAGQSSGSKIGSWVIKDDGRLLEDGLTVFDKLEINFGCQRNISKWAMGCGDEIKQEMVNRNKLKNEAQLLAKRLFMHRSGNNKALLALNKTKNAKAHVNERIESFNLMCARIRFITYVWHGIQYFYMQSELLDAVIAYNEKVVKENTKQYKECNEQTEKMYEYLLLLEEPVAEKVEEQKQLKQKVKLLTQEMEILNAFRSKEAIREIVQR